MNAWARVAVAVSLAVVISGCARPEKETPDWSIGVPGAGPSARYGTGDVAPARGARWIAYSEHVGQGDTRVRIVDATAGPTPPILASFAGLNPSLEVRPDGKLALVTLEGDPRRGTAIVWREGTNDARTWKEPQPIVSGPGWFVDAGRLVSLSKAKRTWLLPALQARSQGAAIICLRSEDDGRTWTPVEVVQSTDVSGPAIAATANGTLVLVARLGAGLARSVSNDAGRTWSRIEPIDFGADPQAPLALASIGDALALAWTEPPPDTSFAAPPIRAVRFATSIDAGARWQPRAALAWRCDRLPGAVALASSGHDRLTALLYGRGPNAADLACITRPLAAFDPTARLVREPGTRFAIDSDAAADALALLGTQILSRSASSQRLFIEGYFQRGLVAAYEALDGKGAWPDLPASEPGRSPARVSWMDTQRGLASAITFADWLVSGQNEHGYWPLGYKAVYVADMAAAIGLFAALAPHVEPARVRAYEAAAQRFVAGLERDRMFLDSGALGIGWFETRSRDEENVSRDPYLVSTALAGIEVQSWLASRTGDARLRDRARAALDWTLAQLQPDGSLPGIEAGDHLEGSYTAAAYVQEGWMAADLFLRDDAVRERLAGALKPHVAWLLRTQRPDGTWGERNTAGEWARTPGIVDFLVWYDRRIEARDDVRAAILTASRSYADPETWDELGLGLAGKNEEVMRALAARALAAIVAGRPVF